MMLSLEGLGDVNSIAQAIAYAEGYYAPGSPGTINSPSVAPVRNNNPCDLGGAGQSYPTIAAGWAACDNQIGLMLNNTSSMYNSSMTIAQIAPIYVCGGASSPCAAGDSPSGWASIVAGQLGVSVDTPISSVGSASPLNPLIPTNSVPAQIPVDSTTGLPASTGTDSSASDPTLDPSTDSDLTVASGISLTDGSGNLTGWGWGAIAAAGLVAWMAA